MFIYITRHGETSWNVEGKTQGIMNIPLTERGVMQAEFLGDRLIDMGITHIYSSNLDRANQTATIIGNRIGIKTETDNDLREVNFGVWEGHSIEEIEVIYPGELKLWRTDFTFRPQNGESLLSVQGRIRAFIDKLKGENFTQNDKILVVSHALTLKILIVELMKMPLKHYSDFKLDNTGISIIKKEEKKSTIICVNDTCHLNKINSG